MLNRFVIRLPQNPSIHFHTLWERDHIFTDYQSLVILLN
ncbi:hypothetical protein BROOK1789C_409 [Bathymodiolus brooksi thiotrophic gill symbiont]|nr:hypothetical protein BROOK1789C_409 [Bathymodiolus brooksi thiotrophic gill symbiont]